MEIELVNGNIIETIDNVGEVVRSKRYDDIPLVFSIKGNYTNGNYIHFPTETLYNAYKDYIGKTVNWIKDEERIVTDVSMDGDYIFIKTIKK